MKKTKITKAGMNDTWEDLGFCEEHDAQCMENYYNNWVKEHKNGVISDELKQFLLENKKKNQTLQSAFDEYHIGVKEGVEGQLKFEYTAYDEYKSAHDRIKKKKLIKIKLIDKTKPSAIQQDINWVLAMKAKSGIDSEKKKTKKRRTKRKIKT